MIKSFDPVEVKGRSTGREGQIARGSCELLAAGLANKCNARRNNTRDGPFGQRLALPDGYSFLKPL